MQPFSKNRDGFDQAGDYRGMVGCLASMHKKEEAIAQPFFRRLGIKLHTPCGLDTDQMGTFTGEIPRLGTMNDAALAKAQAGLQLSGHTLAIASEGSYGPHPALPFSYSGLELMVFVDADKGIAITESILEPSPVYNAVTIGTDFAGLEDFVHGIDLPHHALVTAPNDARADITTMSKGIRNFDDLKKAILRCCAQSVDRKAFVQTDMRAHMNQRRMETIAKLAKRLADRVARSCPECGVAGFGFEKAVLGLPCSECGAPSTLVEKEIWACAACPFRMHQHRPDGLRSADPQYCTLCNP
ncbi:MAG: hypothetical protein IPJ88_16070 [Myxococcales bacterium]|nr:MAG: hypothetical protein IPJ88_16070 [Myxococcales bacterium]